MHVSYELTRKAEGRAKRTALWMEGLHFGGTMEINGGPLRDSFEHHVTIPDFTAPVSQRERVDTTHAASFAQNISVFLYLEQERSSRFCRTVFAAHMFDEEHATMLVELDLAIDKIRSRNLNRLASGFLRNHVDCFLWKRVP